MKLHSLRRIFALLAVLTLVFALTFAIGVVANAEEDDSITVTAVSAYKDECGKVKFDWADVDGASYYRIYINGTHVVNSVASHFVVGELEPETTATIKVVAVNENGAAIISGEGSVEVVHVWNDGEITTPPTCTEPGVKTYTCQNPEHTYTEEVAATGHTEGTPVTENNVLPTCTVDGSYDTVVYCTTCNAELSRVNTVVPATGHTDGTPVTENNVPATCTTAGGYDTVTYCTVCSTETSRVHTDAPATGHTPGAEATCTTNQTCTVCSAEINPAKGHTPGTAATCTAAQICTACGVELAPATGHSYTTTVTAPTCAAGGYTTYTCSCGDTYTANEVPALDHTVVVDEAVAATCSKTGKTEGSHCSVCNKVIVPQSTVPTIAHKEITVKGSDATCTASGLTDGKKCTVCGKVTVAQQEIAKKDHKYEVETDLEKILLYNYCTECGEKGKFATVQFTEQLKTIVVVAACALVIVLAIRALCQPATTTPWWKRRR